MEKEALIIDDLHHKYDNQKISNWILNAINLRIETGELLGLLGPSGCGKTTLLRLIAGFEYPSKGKITLNDREISNRHNILSPEKRRIGMVFQDSALFPHLTALENAVLGLHDKNNNSRLISIYSFYHLYQTLHFLKQLIVETENNPEKPFQFFFFLAKVFYVCLKFLYHL